MTATIASAELADKDGSFSASKGDTITVKFTANVSLKGTDPAAEIALLRTGDSYGTGAKIAAVDSKTVVITLGDAPKLRLTGTYSGPLGKASGLDVNPKGTIKTGGAAPIASGVDIASSLAPAFRPAAAMNTARGLHTATLIGDGRVLIAGGVNASGGKTTFAVENELYDPVTNTFQKVSDPSLGGNAGYMLFNSGTAAAPVGSPIGRISHTATLLPGAKILICGGYGYESVQTTAATATTPASKQAVLGDLRSAFIFDATANKFSYVGSLNVARRDHYALLLPSGKVLIAGGRNGSLNNGQGSTLPAGEIFDPATGKFTMLSTTGNDMMYPREQGAAAPTADGVLFTGGTAFVKASATATAPTLYMAPGAETYGDATKKFAATGALLENRRWHTATSLLSGNVLVAGGDNGSGVLASVERWVAATGKFEKFADLKQARARHGAARILNSVDVIFAGGVTIDYAKKTVTNLSTGEWLDAGNKGVESYQMAIDRNGCRVTQLLGGKVLVTGGFSGGTTVLGLDGTAIAQAETFNIP